MKAVSLTALLILAITSEAQALDCDKAESNIEKAICADPELKAADDAMSKAYAGLRAALPDNEKKALAQSQRKWIPTREQCDSPDRAELVKCVAGKTDARRHLLLGEAESGPGAPSRMVPVFIQQEGSATQYDADYTLVKFAEPKSAGEKLFNKEVEAIANDAPTGPYDGEIPENMDYSAFAGMAIAYASPRLISASVYIWSYDGGAHGNGGLSNINVDLEKGRIVEAVDVFEEAGMAHLRDACTKQIAEQKTAKLREPFKPEDDPTYSVDAVAESLASMTSWTFRADRGIVTFDSYAIGSYAEGSYTCEFPLSDIRAAVKPGAPLPE